ncbi:hypothetical protein BMS3Abin17_00341 [archaeon BMS3Abin17]|nr:hypothetical protein BMS3Abin17_00341 [archaeon BMS3Abin17]HDZ60851.1 hypothetical protein [Candidatus Pacearchaeota archaeon]
MGFLGFGKKKKVVDLSERYRRQQEQAAQIKAESQEVGSETSSASPFGIFDSPATSTDSEESGGYIDVSSSMEDRRKRLAKRLGEMTTKMEDLSNQIYHLQQRIELIERKLDVRSE